MTVLGYIGRFLVFLCCFSAGFGAWMLIASIGSINAPVSVYTCHRGSGIANGRSSSVDETVPAELPAPRDTRDIIVTHKPRPGYTNAARENNESGTVRLRVTFQSDGQIGNIGVVSGLNYGLTDMAINAARKIEFSPRLVDGRPQTVTKMVEYSFSIY